jgi:hypothetical protein
VLEEVWAERMNGVVRVRRREVVNGIMNGERELGESPADVQCQ